MNGGTQADTYARRRAVAAVVLVAVLALVVGLVLGATHQDAGVTVAKRYTTAWEHGDLATMYALTDQKAKGASLQSFVKAYRDAASLATVSTLRFGTVGKPKRGVLDVPAVATTRIFGTVRTVLRLPVSGTGGSAKVAWGPQLVFPGLRSGEALARTTRLAPRAAILARDKTVLAQGPDRSSPNPGIAGSIAGRMGDAPADRRAELMAAGVPDDAPVGLTGLERAFDDRLRGTHGGTLLAGSRTLATSEPRPGRDVRSTISPAVQSAAITAVGARLGAAVALRIGGPHSGEILAAAGIPFSGLQPPGSTMKIVTLSGALQAGITSPSKAYPVQTQALLEGVPLRNANGEYCGGTLAASFAKSCNSVFGPLGARLGAKRLVAEAEAFGFNQDPGIAGAATPTIPSADTIGDDLAVGSSAIGQGKVQATALTMAVVAATIGLEGRRPRPTLTYGATPSSTSALPARTARTVRRLMEGVVTGGTGVSAAIPGVVVAGKTGTAELEDTKLGPDGKPLPADPDNTDAWFTEFAPAGGSTPRVAVCVLLVRAGAGGATAAPAARGVMEAALRAMA